MNKAKEIRTLLNRDGLQEAESITGKSYKKDKFTEGLGIRAIHQIANQKKELLELLGDTTMNNTEENYLRIVTKFDFKSILIEPFITDENIEERLHIMWHYDYSILLVFDTHTWGDDGSWAKSGKKVPPPSTNGGSFYYNWSPNVDCKSNCTSSGGYISNGDKNNTYGCLFNKDFTSHFLPKELRLTEPEIDFDDYDAYSKAFNKWCIEINAYIKKHELINIWEGHHDCREAIVFNINQLAENGTFLKEWKEKPFLWLLHHGDTKNKDYDYEAINAERLAKLPKDIVELIDK